MRRVVWCVKGRARTRCTMFSEPSTNGRCHCTTTLKLDDYPSTIFSRRRNRVNEPNSRREQRLKEAVKKRLKMTTIGIFIDRPPSLGHLTMNALTASDTVLILCNVNTTHLKVVTMKRHENEPRSAVPSCHGT